jgi:dTDP-D-glucose 4,6-dehydratase
MKKIVYITGCLGFIGSHLTRKCLELGWHVRGVDKVTYAANTNLLMEFHKYPNFFFEQKDINDLELLYDAFDYGFNLSNEKFNAEFREDFWDKEDFEYYELKRDAVITKLLKRK